MPHEVAYFDSQASAAAVLKISIDEIRRAKREGCSAFRSGRIYKKPLLKWLAKNKSKRTPRADPKGVLCEVMISLAKKFDAGLIASDDYFERCTKIIAAGRAYRHLF